MQFLGALYEPIAPVLSALQITAKTVSAMVKVLPIYDKSVTSQLMIHCAEIFGEDMPQRLRRNFVSNALKE